MSKIPINWLMIVFVNRTLVNFHLGELYYVIFIIKGFRTIVFIFIVISTMFWPICPPAFFRYLNIHVNECNEHFAMNIIIKISFTSLVMIFIIEGFRTIVFIFIVISTIFRPICPPAFFRCLSNSGIFSEFRTFLKPVLIPLAITGYEC